MRLTTAQINVLNRLERGEWEAWSETRAQTMASHEDLEDLRRLGLVERRADGSEAWHRITDAGRTKLAAESQGAGRASASRPLVRRGQPRQEARDHRSP